MKLQAAALAAVALLPLPAVGQGPAPVSRPPQGNGYWLEAIPGSLEEAALRDVLVRSAFLAPAEKARALVAVSNAHPGTAASGLGELAAALTLLDDQDAGRSIAASPQALSYLRHPDIQRTALQAHATLALGRALEPQDGAQAAAAFLAAADLDPNGPVGCAALLRAGDALEKASQPTKAVGAFERALGACPAQIPQALLRLGQLQEARGEAKAAAAAYDRLDRDFTASSQARDAAPRLAALALLLPTETPEAKRARDLRRGLLLLESGQSAAAVAAFRRVLERRPTVDELDVVRLGLGKALMATKRAREAEIQLGAIGSASPQAAEAAYLLARQRARRGSVVAYEGVVERFPGTAWSEEALLQLANYEQKDARDAEAVPYYRRLLKDRPGGKHTERAAWRVGFFDYREGRYEEAASLLEGVARSRDQSSSTAGFLYWSGRSRAALGQVDRARGLYDETVRRFKHSYHGLRARGGAGAAPALAAWGLRGPPRRHRCPPHRRSGATARRGSASCCSSTASTRRATSCAPCPRPRWAQAHPGLDRVAARPPAPRDRRDEEGLSRSTSARRATGCRPTLWQHPLPHRAIETRSRRKAAEERLDPALVAALVCQESTFDAGAVSRAGARGLMQIMAAHGPRRWRATCGVRYQRGRPPRSRRRACDFGTRYLRQMLDRFGGRVERALAAYNAGPHRVDAWTATRPDVPAEEFVESIPFTRDAFLRHDDPAQPGALPAPLRPSRDRSRGRAAPASRELPDRRLQAPDRPRAC